MIAKGDSLCVLIVNFNGGAMLHRTLDCLANQTVAPKQVIIVDNASTDGSFVRAKKLHPQFHFLGLSTNTGFARGNNYGARFCRQDWLITLNPDAFPDRNWIEEISAGIEKNPNVNSFATIMVRDDDPEIIDSAGLEYQASGIGWARGAGQSLEEIATDDLVLGPSGGAGVYRLTSFLSLGGFDEDFFCYYEDMDLAIRFRLAGEKCVLLRRAIVRHVGSGITGEGSEFSIYHVHRNVVWTFVKNMPTSWLVKNILKHALVNLFSIAVFVRRGHTKTIFKAKWDAILGLKKMIRKRGPSNGQGDVSNLLNCVLPAPSILHSLGKALRERTRVLSSLGD